MGKYTTPEPLPQLQKRTIALCKCNIRIWKEGQLLHPDAPLATLLTADSATICIANTKNGSKNAVVHHEAFGGYLCPVAAIAQQLDNIK